MVANEEWMSMFPKASVFHCSMSISNHCLLALSLKRRQPRKPMRKRFMFEAMWTREDGCRDIIEAAWDPLENSVVYSILDKLKKCQDHLQRWNWTVYENVNKVLRQK